MAESRGSLIAKSVQKHAGRAKEKILQNLGKVDRTADEIFDEHLQNFTRQQNAANRLQKEFNNYIRCIRATQGASKSLLEAIAETYESNWTGHDVLYCQTQSVDMLWQDFHHKLADQVLIPLNTYQSQFSEMRKKIDKRGRKMVDYDSQRHNFQALQANMKKRDDAKIAKGREQLEEAKRTYDMLNSELHDELPALFDSRILFFVTNLQSLFNSEHIFHSEASKIYGELEEIVDKLATDSQRGSYSSKKTNGASLPRPVAIKNSSPLIMNNISPVSSPRPEDLTTKSPTTKTCELQSTKSETQSPVEQESLYANDPINVKNEGGDTPPSTPPPQVPKTPEVNGVTTPDGTAKKSHPDTSNSNNDNVNNSQNSKKVEELYDIPVGASTDNLPPGVLYRVKATYKYTREDVDELSFDVGETIQVIEYDDPEEQEEGWLMGLKEGSNEKGMFPANFTRPL